MSELFAVLGKCQVSFAPGSIIDQFETIFLFQKRYAFRASEILKLEKSSLHDDFNICVKLAKCEEFTFIRDEELYLKLQNIFVSSVLGSFSVNYKDYYRYISKYHKEVIIKNQGHNNKVTHSFRYVSAKNLKKRTNNKKMIKAKLHHQSIKSQDYYLRNNQKK